MQSGLAQLDKNENQKKNDNEIDSASALQQYLDHIPISSIPSITNNNSQVLELKAADSLRDAIHMLYEKDIFGAAILDVSDSNTSMTFSTSYIGIIDFSSMVLWCLEEYEKVLENSVENSPKDDVPKVKDIESHGFFSILDRFPQIGQTKVGDLAKSFLWEPFFPVRLDDTILHALLLISKHGLCLLPVVTQQPGSGLIGFVTQNAVVQFLLQSSGLEWFDSVADKKVSCLSFENRKHPSCVSRGQTVADALKVLWQNQTCAVAVIDQQTKKLIGNVRNSDMYHLVNNDNLLRKRMILSVQEFIDTEIDNINIEEEGFLPQTSLSLKSSFIPKMDSPVTNKENDTLKQIMEHMTETNSTFTFLINDNEQVTGLVTLRDIILQFAPPCVDSTIHGGGFFQFALEQSGCHVKNGTIIPNHSY